MKKFIYWLPRVLGVLYIIFLTMFSLDVFDMGLSWWQAIGAFFIHSIPSLLLTVLLVWAWRRPKAGGVAFLVFVFLFVVWYFWTMHNRWTIAWLISNLLILSLPIFLVGLLFLNEGYPLKKLFKK